MKNSSAVFIVFISVVIIIIISTFGDASTYVTFNKARDMYQSGSMSKVHVVGKLNKDKNNKIIEGNPYTIKTANDVWKYSKNMWSQDPRWYLIETSNK